MATKETYHHFQITVAFPNSPSGYKTEVFMLGVTSAIGKELMDFQQGVRDLSGYTSINKAAADTITIAMALGSFSVVTAKCLS